MKLIQTTLLSGLASVIRIGTGVVSTKIIAVYLGAPGVVLLAQFTSVLSIVQLFGSGVNAAVVKYVSEYRQDEKRLLGILGTAFMITLGTTVLASVLLVLFSRYAAIQLLKSPDYQVSVMVGGLLLVAQSINNYYLSVLNGIKDIKTYFALNVISACLGLGSFALLAVVGGIKGALVAQSVAQVIVLGPMWVAVKRHGWFGPKRLVGCFEVSTVPTILRFVGMMAVSTVVSNMALIFVRDRMIEGVSLDAAGYWQGVVRLSDAYMALITTSLATYYLPRLSEISAPRELRRELAQGYALIMPLINGLAFCVYWFRDLAISLLYTESFRPMRELFAFQLVGDVLKMASWLLGYLTVAKAMAGWFVFSEIFHNVVFVGSATALIREFGAIGVTYAYALSYGIFLILMVVLFHRLIFLSRPI